MKIKMILIKFSLILVALGILGTFLHGAVIHVTTTEDNVPGSLRAAITTANATDENDTIYLPAGTYVLTGYPEEDGNLSGDLDIDNIHTIKIIGDGVKKTHIDGGGNDRVFHILEGTLSLTGITIQGGRSEDQAHGGAIFNRDTLILTKCSINSNSAGDGRWWNGFNSGNGGNGGGIYNFGTLTLTDSTIMGNSAGAGNGSSMNRAGNGGSGGGIYNMKTATLTRCTLFDNRAGNGGETSSAGYPGGDGGSGGGIFNGGTLTLTNCTFYDNKAGYGDESDGGGNGIGGNGGAVCNTGAGVTTFKHCTITANTVLCPYYLINYGHGGGVYNDPSGTINIENTIIANNKVESDGTGPDCYGILNSLGYNIIQDMTDCTLTGDSTGNITGKDPLLNALANNGGDTYTCSFKQGSPAVDAGYSSGISTDQRNFPRPRDIPGLPNASDGADIGAFELESQYTISGTITANGIPLADVSLTFGDGGETVVTDKNGKYSILVPYGWSGFVVPSKEDYSFNPSNREYTNVKTDKSTQDYTATAYSVSISILSPSNGDTVSGTVTVSVSASSSISSTTDSSVQSLSGVALYIDGIYKETGTAAPYKFKWDTTQYSNGDHHVKVKAANAASMTQEAEITVTVKNLTHMFLSRNRLNFGTTTTGIKSDDQSFIISSNDNVPFNWTVSIDSVWVDCSVFSGTGPGIVTVSVDYSQMIVGVTYIGTITVTSPDADNSPLILKAYMTVYSALEGPWHSSPPFGSFDTPVNGSTVFGSVPVTGWVLDDIGIKNIKIYREPVAGEGNALIYIGDAVTVEGARPDIEVDYPDYPLNYKAGWGYMMLSNFLPNQGNGTFTLHAIAADKEGHSVTLGTTNIICDNANSVKPFGTLDTPEQGGTISGNGFINFGWALTPQPNAIPTNGSTIDVMVDGVSLGHPVYNQYREDIASFFPGYANSNGAVGYFTIDTTQYENGVHTISWIVEDDAGNADGIGSRYFNIQNTTANRQWSITGVRWNDEVPSDYFNSVGVVKGFGKNSIPQLIYPGNDGIITVEIKETERVVIHLGNNERTSSSSSFITHHSSFSSLTPLPVGSTFDAQSGIFYWQPSAGFLGEYEFIFSQRLVTGELYKRFIKVTVAPKFGHTVPGT